MFNSANFYLLQKFWVSCQFVKAIQYYSLVLNKILTYSDIRSAYVELDDHMSPTQSDKTRRLLNIKK